MKQKQKRLQKNKQKEKGEKDTKRALVSLGTTLSNSILIKDVELVVKIFLTKKIPGLFVNPTTRLKKK